MTSPEIHFFVAHQLPKFPHAQKNWSSLHFKQNSLQRPSSQVHSFSSPLQFSGKSNFSQDLFLLQFLLPLSALYELFFAKKRIKLLLLKNSFFWDTVTMQHSIITCVIKRLEEWSKMGSCNGVSNSLWVILIVYDLLEGCRWTKLILMLLNIDS